MVYKYGYIQVLIVVEHCILLSFYQTFKKYVPDPYANDPDTLFGEAFPFSPSV